MRTIKYKLVVGMNTIAVQDGYQLKLRYLNDQEGKIMGWFEEVYDQDMLQHSHEVYVALTGEYVPDEYQYVCSHQINQGGGYFVVHAYD